MSVLILMIAGGVPGPANECYLGFIPDARQTKTPFELPRAFKPCCSHLEVSVALP